MDRRGMTLIELLVVIAIIGILAAVAVPSYVGQQKRAVRAEAYANLETLRLLQEQYYAENGEYTDKDAASSGIICGVSAIQNKLRAFKPGNENDLYFTYLISYTVSSGITNAFTATAVGRANTRVSGDNFWINQNNTKNF